MKTFRKLKPIRWFISHFRQNLLKNKHPLRNSNKLYFIKNIEYHNIVT